MITLLNIQGLTANNNALVQSVTDYFHDCVENVNSMIVITVKVLKKKISVIKMLQIECSISIADAVKIVLISRVSN